jgi:hypothetical protein
MNNQQKQVLESITITITLNYAPCQEDSQMERPPEAPAPAEAVATDPDVPPPFPKRYQGFTLKGWEGRGSWDELLAVEDCMDMRYTLGVYSNNTLKMFSPEGETLFQGAYADRALAHEYAIQFFTDGGGTVTAPTAPQFFKGWRFVRMLPGDVYVTTKFIIEAPDGEQWVAGTYHTGTLCMYQPYHSTPIVQRFVPGRDSALQLFKQLFVDHGGMLPVNRSEKPNKVEQPDNGCPQVGTGGVHYYGRYTGCCVHCGHKNPDNV